MIIYYESDGSIKIIYEKNTEIQTNELPSYITNLHFYNLYNTNIKPNILPISLQKIYPNVIPSSVELIEFGKGFKQKINCNVLPSILTHLFFKGGYNHKILLETLPKKLKVLSFHYNKHEINKFVLPSSLIQLRLGYNYNFEFKNYVLPNKLEYLELCGIYSTYIKRSSRNFKNFMYYR